MWYPKSKAGERTQIKKRQKKKETMKFHFCILHRVKQTTIDQLTIRFSVSFIHSLLVCHLSSNVWTDALETQIKSFCSFFRTLQFDSTDYSGWLTNDTCYHSMSKTNRCSMWPKQIDRKKETSFFFLWMFEQGYTLPQLIDRGNVSQ